MNIANEEQQNGDAVGCSAIMPEIDTSSSCASKGAYNSNSNNNSNPANIASDTQSVIIAVQEEQQENYYTPLLPIQEDPSWERLRKKLVESMIPYYDDVFDESHLALLRSTYVAGIHDGDVLKSIACLSLSCSSSSNGSVVNYDQHVMTLAKCLARPPRSLRKNAKLACVRALMTLLTPLEASWQLHDRVIQDSLRFIIDRTYVWEYLDHSHEILLWELRAMVLREMDLRQDQLSEKVAQGGDVAAEWISKSARCVERGVEQSTTVVTTGIEGAGSKLKKLLKPEDIPLLEANLRAKVVAMAYSDYAKRATDGARETSHKAMTRIQSASVQGVHTFANHFEDGKMGERILPHEQSREVLWTVGRVGIAAVGGAAVVADSLVKSTGTVAKTTAAVTADVVQHKYGQSAGQLVRNSSDTVGNVFRTVGHVTLLHKSSAIANSVSRETCLMHLTNWSDKSLMDEANSDDEEEAYDDGDGNAQSDDDSEHFSEQQILLQENETVGPLELNEENIRDFDTDMAMSPAELDLSLPDEITTNDAQSDFFFSDITNATFYVEDSDNYGEFGHLLQREESSRSSLFRNLDDSFNTHLSEDDLNKLSGSEGILHKQDCSGDSLGYTACTVEESFITNGSILEDNDESQQERMSAVMLSQPYDIQEDMYYNDGDSTNSSPAAPDQESLMRSSGPLRTSLHNNRIPPNGYVTSSLHDATATRGSFSAWPKGIYSSIKSRLRMY